MDTTGKRRVEVTRDNNMVIDQIMLRYRPIAPRPVNGEGSGQSFQATEGLVSRKRVKRKYVRVKEKKVKNNSNNNINKNWYDMDDQCNGNELVVTDPLEKVTNWISFGGNIPFESENDAQDIMTSDLHGGDVVGRRSVTESWITVETVTGTCDDRKVLGYCDEEIWKNLEGDTCPCFVSNSFDEVVWVNQGYKRLLDLNCGGGGGGGDVAVCLVLKVDRSVLVKYLPAFSCSVRVEYRLLSENEKKMRMIVPCDVCAMDSGGFAWRLDVVSALSLGPIN